MAPEAGNGAAAQSAVASASDLSSRTRSLRQSRATYAYRTIRMHFACFPTIRMKRLQPRLQSLSIVALTLLTCLLCTRVFAADSHRPRIGLVLSGGGARGAAHVGVLKVLDEMH